MPRSTKSYEERIDEKDEEIRKALEKVNQIKEQKKALEKRRKEADRKARTHRLIVIGGIAEKALGREFVDGDEELFEKFLYGQESRGGYYSRAMENHSALPEGASDMDDESSDSLLSDYLYRDETDAL